MNEMAKRVRAALLVAMQGTVDEVLGETLDALAVAAIEAMREPSDEVLKAAFPIGSFVTPKIIWQKMIDAALSKEAPNG